MAAAETAGIARIGEVIAKGFGHPVEPVPARLHENLLCMIDGRPWRVNGDSKDNRDIFDNAWHISCEALWRVG